MAMPIFTAVEEYEAFHILRQVQLNDLATSIENYCNNIIRNNIIQVSLDVFGSSYSLNNNGIQTRTPFLAQAAAILADDEVVTGNWAFSGTVSFTNVVSSTSTFSSSGQQRCRVWRSTSNQAIADATETAISFVSESYDVGSMHDTSLNPQRITIPSGGSGVYAFSAQVRFAAAAAGRREVYIFKNGSKFSTVVVPTASAGFDSFVQIDAQDQGTAGDFYEVYVYQSSGGALDVVFGERNTYFSALRAW